MRHVQLFSSLAAVMMVDVVWCAGSVRLQGIEGVHRRDAEIAEFTLRRRGLIHDFISAIRGSGPSLSPQRVASFGSGKGGTYTTWKARSSRSRFNVT